MYKNFERPFVRYEEAGMLVAAKYNANVKNSPGQRTFIAQLGMVLILLIALFNNYFKLLLETIIQKENKVQQMPTLNYLLLEEGPDNVERIFLKKILYHSAA